MNNNVIAMNNSKLKIFFFASVYRSIPARLTLLSQYERTTSKINVSLSSDTTTNKKKLCDQLKLD